MATTILGGLLLEGHVIYKEFVAYKRQKWRTYRRLQIHTTRGSTSRFEETVLVGLQSDFILKDFNYSLFFYYQQFTSSINDLKGFNFWLLMKKCT